MTFITIFGPSAVGKMATAFELAKLLDFRVLHNHMTREVLWKLFPHGSPEFRTLDVELRQRIFEEFVKGGQQGLIFTFVLALDLQSDTDYLQKIISTFEQTHDIFLIELEADQKIRLQRNKTPIRLEEKPTKRDIQFSEKILVRDDLEHVLNSDPKKDLPGNQLIEKYQSVYKKINNSDLTVEETAKKIEEFVFSKTKMKEK